MLSDDIYGRDYRSEIDLSDNDMIGALEKVVPQSKDLSSMIRAYQNELIESYNAPSQCTVTLLATIRAIYLTQVQEPIKEDGLLEVDPMTHYQYVRFKPLTERLKNVGQKIMEKVTLQDLWESEIDGTEDNMIVVD